jgi:sigma-B regulation protein RsbU (phosphoserine phosphatase)
LLLGVDPDYVYQQCQFRLQAGETLTLYTDGVIDAVNSIEEFYHESRLISVLKSCGGGAEQLGHAILADIARFVGREDQNDDICLICLGRR